MERSVNRGCVNRRQGVNRRSVNLRMGVNRLTGLTESSSHRTASSAIEP
jgi:hypothetical protein